MMGRPWKLHITEEVAEKNTKCGFDECSNSIRKGELVIMVKTAKNNCHVIRLCSRDCQWEWHDARAEGRLEEIE